MASRDPERPNVVLVLADDLGPWALGCAGNPEIRTPHIDGLAAEGTRLSRFFCTSPVCSPARASLLTGEMPSVHGVHDYLDARHVGPDGTDFLAGRRSYTDDLADAGYRLGLVGKWHLGANDRPRPGFVRWLAHAGGGGPYHGAPLHDEHGPVDAPGYVTDVLTDAARQFVAAEADRPEPFYLSLHYTAPHSPWKGHHPAEYTDLYADCAFDSVPQEPTHPWVPLVDGHPIGGEADTRAALEGYFAAVSAMDAGVGGLLAEVAAQELEESTLVIFTSDNGFSCGQHGIWGKGNATFPQNMYDESVLVPFVARLPGRVPAGQVSDSLLSAYDLAPTLRELCGLGAGPGSGPGRSFAGLLRGDADEGHDRVVVFDEYGPVRMLRTRSHKYVHRYPLGPHELYDLVADPAERTNLVDDPDHAGLRAELAAELDAWFRRHTSRDADGRVLPVTGAGQVAPLSEGTGAFREAAQFRAVPRY
ncbi:sulfatase family protein [Georgenia subflava]|uniref:Sulfatase-like hydrolase/transferase n=1 Tax=Georgenia subflava TaxID=1622177 RepID=A0A6N7EPR4_9MICO|nr:sulfatase-like hydrolase/transferase [Georgenia subflava]MPV38146.1 sulfatase-like hydrolase/transferase [Georgenia subflava]